jgi:hypothetical protein
MKHRDTSMIARHIRALLPEPLTVRETARGKSLGEALGIREAARLIGCSPWTVRQTLIRQGLPCFRSGPNGKLIFYRDQIILWIERHQKAGGGIP